MIRYVFDVTAASAPLGAVLVRLTPGNGLRLAYRRPYHGFGMKDGYIQVHTDHAVATAANFAKHNLVTVRGILDDDTEFWAGEWFLEEGDFAALSNKGKAGRLLRFTGPNSIYLLDRGALLNNVYAPAQPRRGSADIDGQWTWINEPPGAWLVRGIEEGQNQPGTPLQHASIDFSRTHDSDAVPWVQVDDTIQFPVGQTKILDLALAAIKMGLIFQPGEGLAFHAHQTFGEDHTGAAFGAGVVRFTPANITNEITRAIRASVERSHVLVEGLEATFQEVGGGSSPVGYWDYTRVDSDTADTLTAVGARDLAARELESDAAFPVRHACVDDPVNGKYVAFYHYGPGALVTLHTGTGDHDFNERSIEVAAIRLTHDDAGRWFAEPELGSQYMSAENRAWQERANSIIKEARTGHYDRFFVDNSVTDEPLRMAMRDHGIDPDNNYYYRIYSARGADTYLELSANVKLRSGDGGGLDIHADGGMSLHADGGMTVDADGGLDVHANGNVALRGDGNARVVGIVRADYESDGKHIFMGVNGATESLGIVVPVRTADPAAGDSEDGQVYYNSVSDTLRLRANGAWGDVDAAAVTAALAAHIADVADAHAASAIGFTPTGATAATDTQAAIVEVAADSQARSEKGAANGYASLGADTLVPQDQLGTGTQDGTKFLRDDGTWQTVATGAPADDTSVWMPLTTVVGGVPELVWDASDSLIPTLTPI